MKAERAAESRHPGVLFTLRRRCNARERGLVPALSRASTLGARRIARREAALHASAAAPVATQSRHCRCTRALQLQRRNCEKRNFSLDLPLVAYPTQAEYEQLKCCSGAWR